MYFCFYVYNNSEGLTNKFLILDDYYTERQGINDR
jgi:hypothetical protein